MSDPLRFPCRDRESPFDLNELADMTNETLDGDERRVVRQVGLNLVLDQGSRIESFGDVLDVIAAAGPAGRREMVDAARAEVGLPTIADEQAAVHVEAANRAVRPNWGITQCAAKGCTVWATNEVGSLRPVADRRWWCPRHRDQAGPEDHLPEPPRYVLNSNFALVPVGAEAERLRREDEERQEEWKRREEVKRREGERLAKLRQEHEEQTTVSIAGVRVRNGTIVPP